MSAMGLILVLCVYPCVLFMYFFVKNDATPENGLYFGVTLNKDQAAAPEVQQIMSSYKKQMRLLFWLILLMPIPMLFIPWFSILMTGWSIWLLASIVVFFIPFGLANKKLKELKTEKGWKQEQENAVHVEIKSAGLIRRVKGYHFLPQTILSLLVVVVALVLYRDDRMEAMSILVGSFALVTILFWLIAVWMDRQKTQIISTDSEVNVNYARAKKNLWKNLWVVCAWINTIYMFCLLFSLDNAARLTKVFMGATIVYIMLTLSFLLWILRKKKKVDGAYRDKMDAVIPDDDDNWIWGMFYYNPKDKHSMVEKRTGIGTTTNMATPVGKAVWFFAAVSLLALPIVCIWMILLEFTPIQLSVTNNQLVASQIDVDYTIPLFIVEEAELLTELPKWSKISGVGMDELKKGTFRIAEEGRCEVFLNPQNELFIRFEVAGTTYYMSGFDDAETRAVYEVLVGE